MNIRDFAERLVWTFIVAATANVTVGSILDIAEWKIAALTGAAAVVQTIATYGRKRLSVLPDPGDGLPGYPTPQAEAKAARNVEQG